MKLRDRQTHRRGVVLVLTLLVLTLAITYLTSAARRSSAAALRAVEASEKLQVRWTQKSLIKALTPTLGDRIRRREVAAGQPVRRHTGELAIGGQQVWWVADDEQAKVNLHMLASRHQRQELPSQVEEFCSRDRAWAMVRLRPVQEGLLGEAISSHGYYSYDQVFADASPSSMIGPRPSDTPRADQITLWSDGRVHLHRSPPQVIKAALVGVLDGAEQARLLSFRNERPDATAIEAAQHLELPPERARRLAETVTTRSMTQSLWIVIVGPTRSYYRLEIRSESGNHARQNWSFTW